MADEYGFTSEACTEVITLTHWLVQVSVTWVKAPLLHEREKLPKYPLAQVPVSVLPLVVVVRTHSLFVAAVQAAAAQVSETSVRTPLAQA